MIMAKKTRILFAALLVLVMVFTAACTPKETDSDKDDKKSDKGNASLSDIFGKIEMDDEEPQVETTAPSMDINTMPTEDDETEPTEDNEQPQISGDLVGTVLYDRDGIKITVTAFDTNGYYGPEIEVIISNTSDKEVLVNTQNLSVNGYMMDDALLYAEVEPGTEVEDFFMFSSNEMARRGIKELSKVEFFIEVMDPETYETIHKTGLLTLNLTPECNQAIDYSGTELYNDGSIRIIYKGMESNSLFDGLVYFFIENSTGKDVSVYADSITINGVQCDEVFWADLRKGTVVLDTMVLWDLSAVNLESIDQIETMELKFRVIDSESWDDLTVTDTVTINIEK
jgi:hypothetical protein